MKKSIFSDGSVLARPFAAPVKVEEEPEVQLTETAFFESVDDDAMLEAVERQATIGLRQNAAAACHQWVAGGDADHDELDAILFGMAGGEDDAELTDSQNEMYESLQDAAGEYIALACDAKPEDIEMMMEDAEAAERVFMQLESVSGDVDSDESITEFALRESMMMEATKKVIRNGQVKLIKTKKRKRRMSAAQKAALKKARRKSQTGAAKAARKKANRMRKSRGM